MLYFHMFHDLFCLIMAILSVTLWIEVYSYPSRVVLWMHVALNWPSGLLSTSYWLSRSPLWEFSAHAASERRRTWQPVLVWPYTCVYFGFITDKWWGFILFLFKTLLWETMILLWSKIIKSVRLIPASNDYENNEPLKKTTKKDWLVKELFIDMMFSQSWNDLLK